MTVNIKTSDSCYGLVYFANNNRIILLSLLCVLHRILGNYLK